MKSFSGTGLLYCIIRESPLNLLKKAGVDLSEPQPIVAAISLFEELVNEFLKSVKAGA